MLSLRGMQPSKRSGVEHVLGLLKAIGTKRGGICFEGDAPPRDVAGQDPFMSGWRLPFWSRIDSQSCRVM